jgi:hypothetical protein
MPRSTQYSPYDVIVPLPSYVVDGMIDHGAHPLPLPGLYFPPIPAHIRRVWIYEDGAEAITVMIALNQYTLPSRLYFITNPLFAEVMESRYNFHRNQIPSAAPFQIIRRFRYHLWQIW